MTRGGPVSARLLTLALVGLVVLTALAGCGGGTGGQLTNPVDTLGHNDVNPRPRDQVRDGGDLRLPLQSMPSNFNPDEVDGATVDLPRLSRAILPAPFLGTADGGLRLGTAGRHAAGRSRRRARPAGLGRGARRPAVRPARRRGRAGEPG